MASYLRPRRGKKATAIAQLTASAPLKRGEVFFEVPDAGTGTGAGRIKMGDGSTAYESLPYFLEPFDPNSATVGFTNATAAESDPYTTNATHANAIVPSANLKTIFTNLKQLLLNFNSQLTTLNNDLGSHNHDSRYYTESEIDSKLSYSSTKATNVNIDGTISCYKFGNIVCVTGVFKPTSSGTNTLATIPSGYRPRNQIVCCCIKDTSYGYRNYIYTDGRIAPQNTMSNDSYYTICVTYVCS